MEKSFPRYDGTTYRLRHIIRTSNDLSEAVLSPYTIVRETIDRELAKYGFITALNNHDLFLNAARAFFTLENVKIR